MRNLEKLRGKINPVDRAPSLRRVNGWGCSLVGRYKDPEIAPLYYALYVFTVVWIPLMPVQIYIVSGDFSGYRFWATISARDFAKLYPNGILKLSFSCLAESAVRMRTRGPSANASSSPLLSAARTRRTGIESSAAAIVGDNASG
jgi:hypothetical protein